MGNSRLKFRAWDGKRKEWYGASDPHSLTFYGFAIFGECTLLCTPSSDDIRHLEITQFTGLKDRNGREIYEGDVIKILQSDWPSKPDSDPRPLEEYLDALAEWYVVSFKAPEFIALWHGESDGEHYLNCGRHGYIEVIGNVFENGDLLK